MALYRLSVSVVSRGNTGLPTTRNAVAMAAYQAREPIYDRRQSTLRDLTRDAHDLIHSEILLPKLAPYRWFDREVLWNEVEAREHRQDAQLARAIVLSLPRELDAMAGAELAREFFGRTFVGAGMVVDMAIHTKVASDHEPQPHAHALLTMRRIVDGAFALKERAWNSAALLKQWRADWAETANRALASAGAHVRVDHRSWAARRERVTDVVTLVKGLAIIGASVTTQAMRDAARRFRPAKHERRQAVPPAVSRTPVEALRDELRRPLRAAAVGVAAGAWSYGEAADRLVADYVLPALRRHPELEARFEELEQGVGAALAKASGRLEAQIAHNAGLLREKAKGREVTMSDGRTTQEMRDLARQVISTSGRQNVTSVDDANYVARAGKRLGVPDDMPPEERKYMAFAVRVQRGEVEFDGDFPAAGAWKRFEQDYAKEAAMTTQEERDRARQAMPPRQAHEASRRAQEEATQTHALTL